VNTPCAVTRAKRKSCATRSIGAALELSDFGFWISDFGFGGSSKKGKKSTWNEEE
jgi:hypothetical protein